MSRVDVGDDTFDGAVGGLWRPVGREDAGLVSEEIGIVTDQEVEDGPDIRLAIGETECVADLRRLVGSGRGRGRGTSVLQPRQVRNRVDVFEVVVERRPGRRGRLKTGLEVPDRGTV